MTPWTSLSCAMVEGRQWYLLRPQKLLGNIVCARILGAFFIIMIWVLKVIDAFITCLTFNFHKILVISTHTAHKTWHYASAYIKFIQICSPHVLRVLNDFCLLIGNYQ